MEDEDYPADEAPDLDTLDWSSAAAVARAEDAHGRRAVRVAWALAYLDEARNDVPIADFVDVPPKDDPRRGRDWLGAPLTEEQYVRARAQNIVRREHSRQRNADARRSAKADKRAANRAGWKEQKDAEEVARVAAKHRLDPTLLTYADARRVVMGEPMQEYVETDDELAREFHDRLEDPDS